MAGVPCHTAQSEVDCHLDDAVKLDLFDWFHPNTGVGEGHGRPAYAVWRLVYPESTVTGGTAKA